MLSHPDNTIRLSFYASRMKLIFLCHSCQYIVWSVQIRKHSHRLSDRLASLGVMGPKLLAPLKPVSTIVLWMSEAFHGVLNWAPWCRQSLGQIFKTLVSRMLVCRAVWSLLFWKNIFYQNNFPVHIFEKVNGQQIGSIHSSKPV